MLKKGISICDPIIPKIWLSKKPTIENMASYLPHH